MPVVESSALDHQVLEEAQIRSFGTLITLTNNGNVNLMITKRASEEFALPKVLAVFPHNDDNNIKTNKQKINQAFMSQFSIKTWNQYLTDGHFKLGKTTIKPNAIDLQQIHLQTMINTGELLPLLVQREGKLQILAAGEEWKIGMKLFIYYMILVLNCLSVYLAIFKYSRFSLDKLPEVEEIPISGLTKASI